MTDKDVLLAERAAMCDSFERFGPDAPTLCDGWTAADLAAHLVVREHDPRAMPGIILGGKAGDYTAKLMAKEKEKGFDAMVARLRAGPPGLMMLGPGARLNVNENFIHHEDLRRANGEGPRHAAPMLDDVIWSGLAFAGKMSARAVKDAGLELIDPAGHRRRTIRKGAPTVTMTGPPGELTLFLSGRKDAAQVELDGDAEAVARVRAARFGI
jgi:uncharacterized protein (TIGR03085 family)